MDIITIIMLACIVISGLFTLLAAVGLLRFPDVYTRMHAATKASTFGFIFTACAVIAYGVKRYLEVEPTFQPSFITLISHCFIAIIAILVTNPTGAHAIARAALRSGIKPEAMVVDESKEMNHE